MLRKLSAPRRELLVRLRDAGGCLIGKRLSVPSRSLASKMSRDRLVRWERPLGSRHANLEDWALHIEPAGLSAIEQAG